MSVKRTRDAAWEEVAIAMPTSDKAWEAWSSLKEDVLAGGDYYSVMAVYDADWASL